MSTCCARSFVMNTLQEGRAGTYYTPFPVLGVASDGDIFLTAGGGGASASKEVPNVVQAHRYNEKTKKLSTITSYNTDKTVVMHLSHCPFWGLWLASAGSKSMVLALDTKASTLKSVNEWQTEFGKDPTQTVARFSGSGDICGTGGSDGVLKIWQVENPRKEPSLTHSCKYVNEILDLDFSLDGSVIAACDKSVAQLWSTTTGDKVATLAIPKEKKVGPRKLRFVPNTRGIDPILLVALCGPRGPAIMGLFNVSGTMIRQTIVHKTMPISAMAVDQPGKRIVVNSVDGDKLIYSVEGLRCIKKVKGAHDLPASDVTFVGENTAASGSGDRSLNLIDARGGGSSPLQFVFLIGLLFAMLFLLHWMGFVNLQRHWEL